MAQKRQTPLSTKEKLSLAQKAKQTERLGDLAKMVDANLATKPTESWRKLTVEHKDIVLFRLAAGDTVKHVCDQLGISAGCVYMARHLDEQFKKDFELARRAGSQALVNRLREVSRDATLSDTAKKIESDNLKWIAARTDRGDWAETVNVNTSATVTINAPQWMYGSQLPPPTLDGEIIDPDADQHD